MTMTYRTYPVLDVMPTAEDGGSETVSRFTLLTANPAGGQIVQFPTRTSAVERPFAWFLASRADVQAMRDFVASVRGRYRPFWAPSWHEDFVPVGATPWVVDAGHANRARLSFQAFGFPQLFREQQVRHLALLTDGAVSCYPIWAAATLDATTEQLWLDTTGVPAELNARTRLSQLVFSRLASDTVELRWYPPDAAEVTLTLVTLARETPV